MHRPILRPLSALAVAAVAAAIALPVPTVAQAANRTKVGTLSCDISGGIGLIITSKKDVTCMFTPSRARSAGSVRRLHQQVWSRSWRDRRRGNGLGRIRADEP